MPLMATSTPAREGALEKTRVLLVDDSADITDLYGRMIDAEPDLVCAGALHSADSLVESVSRVLPCVVVIDLTMPGEDPLAAIRSLAASHPCPIIAFSGYDDPETHGAALDAGAWSLVSKHGEPTRLLREIRRISRERRLR